jgi:hypothetical protein
LGNWSPITKLLLGVAVLAIPYLLWTTQEEEPVSAVVRQPSAASPVTTTTAAPAAATELNEEPPILRLPGQDHFHGMIERPLFVADRRPPEPVAEAPASGPEEPVPEGPDIAAEPGGPEVRFVGTVGRHGEMTALVLRGEETQVEKLVVGDEVDGWRVTEVRTSELVIEHEGERRVLTILQ